MQKIDFEAHFYSRNFYELLSGRADYPYYTRDERDGTPRIWYAPTASVNHGELLVSRLLDVGDGRIALMDAAGVDAQVVSLSEPSVELFDAATGVALARETNDALAAAIARHPERLLGFAAIAPQDPAAGVRELERCVRELGFVGWLTHANFGKDRYLDDTRYWPLLEAAEALGAPIYIHPSFPAITELHAYGFALAGAPFGFQFETAMCLMRLILAGAFDRFPRLQVILGHLGEALPFFIERLDFPFVRPWFNPADRPALQRKPSEVLRENSFVTISGRYYEPAFRCTLEALGAERMLFATDYPYETMADAVQFIDGVPIAEEDRAKICHGNARGLGVALAQA